MFGCGDQFPFARRLPDPYPQADRLSHMDELDQAVLEARRRGAAFAMSPNIGSGSAPRPSESGRIHVVPSTAETVRLGVFDATLPNVLEIDSGDVVVYPDTWSHFLNRV